MMIKKIFLLIALFIMTAFYARAKASDDEETVKIDTSETLKKDDDKKIEEFDPSTTLKVDGDTKEDFDPTTTLDRSSNKEASKSAEEKIKELIKQDPKTAKLLLAKAKDMTKLLKEAKKYKATRTAKTCAKIINALKIMAKFHNGKKVSNKKLYQAYLNCKYIEKDIKQINIQITSAKRNTPLAKKIRKFQRSAKNYLKQAQRAAKKGNRAETAYYKTCAKFKQKAAAVYAKNPKIEAICKKQIKKAKIKYNHDSMKESAVRFRKLAKKYREDEYDEKVEYYEKAATLKEKLAKAYAKDNKNLIKSLKKEYETLQKTKN